jgi:hypothetical protein
MLAQARCLLSPWAYHSRDRELRIEYIRIFQHNREKKDMGEYLRIFAKSIPVSCVTTDLSASCFFFHTNLIHTRVIPLRIHMNTRHEVQGKRVHGVVGERGRGLPLARPPPRMLAAKDAWLFLELWQAPVV